MLFTQTFAENISLGLHVTPEEIETAAKRARAHDFIMQTKEGYSTKAQGCVGHVCMCVCVLTPTLF